MVGLFDSHLLHGNVLDLQLRLMLFQFLPSRDSLTFCPCCARAAAFDSSFCSFLVGCNGSILTAMVCIFPCCSVTAFDTLSKTSWLGYIDWIRPCRGKAAGFDGVSIPSSSGGWFDRWFAFSLAAV
jgi:hypothetical protein